MDFRVDQGVLISAGELSRVVAPGIGRLNMAFAFSEATAPAEQSRETYP